MLCRGGVCVADKTERWLEGICHHGDTVRVLASICANSLMAFFKSRLKTNLFQLA